MTLEELIDTADIKEIKRALAEIKQMRKDLEALKVQRKAVVAAIDEVEALQDNVAVHAKKIKQHLKEAL